jgi:hypothetical protein
VSFTKVRGEGTYRLTQYEGKFTGIEKKGLTSNTESGEGEKKFLKNEKSSTSMTNIKPAFAGKPLSNPPQDFLDKHLYYEASGGLVTGTNGFKLTNGFKFSF